MLKILMKASRLLYCLLCFYGLSVASEIKSAKIEALGNKTDFSTTPNYLIPYPLLEKASRLKEKCVAKVTYRDGKITGTQMDATSGNEAVDRAILEHIQNTYTVKPGKSGSVLAPIRLPGNKAKDFVSRPAMILPARMARLLKGMKSDAAVVLHYNNGVFTEFNIYQSSGNERLDLIILQHVNKSFRLKPGATGWTVLPVAIRL